MALLVFNSTSILTNWQKSSSLQAVCAPQSVDYHHGHKALKQELRASTRIWASCNPFQDQPILREAVKEPVAFLGGLFAGLLRLDLNEDPLKEWISNTVEASGMGNEGENAVEKLKEEVVDNSPQQIEIE